MGLKITGIVLAAGLSRRAGSVNKLLLPWRGSTVVGATTRAMCEARFDELIVVTGHDRERVESALADLPVRFVFADDFARGMGCSLAAGIRAVDANAEGFAVTPGDLPRLTPGVVRTVADAFRKSGGQKHIVPACGDERGHPVLLGGWLRDALSRLSGDIGARVLLGRPEEMARTEYLDIPDAAIWQDVDDGCGE